MMVLETQTVQQQAGRRLDTILNDYPIDYYDKYASLIAQVEASQVREVMEKYVTPDRMTIVVVAPPEAAEQLAAFGEVVRVQMPLAGQMPQR
jgi:predicted Zn-dependent peptidase